MASLNNYESHALFPQFLLLDTDSKLYEFLTRVDNGVLQWHIQNAFTAHGLIGYTVSCFVRKPHKDDIYVVINIKKDNSQIGHITFHLLKSNITHAGTGPFHVVNNTTKRAARIHVTRSINRTKGVKLSLGRYVVPNGRLLPNNILQISNIIFDIINNYCDPTNPLFLGNNIATMENDSIKNLVSQIRISHRIRMHYGGKKYSRKYVKNRRTETHKHFVNI
jgi:hypothetical protein